MCLALVFASGALAACPSSDPETSQADGGPGTPGGPAGPPLWLGVAGDRLGPLPPHETAKSTLFATNDHCAQCHLAGDGNAVKDAKGRDVSPVGTWRASAMALATRDPYYLAALADELEARPAFKQSVERTCLRCHAPEGAIELEVAGKTAGFATLTSEATPEARLAREGVACTICHQIEAEDLGTPASFTGNFVVGGERKIYGPYADPLTDPMRTFVNYTPMFGSQIQRSALCATCHTLVLKRNGSPDFPEQVPYLEWLASSYSNEGAPKGSAATCQDCHMAITDDDGAELAVPIARVPAGLSARKPYWRHGFAGANVQLSRFGAADPTWFGVPVTRDEHEGQLRRNEAMLRTSATLAIANIVRSGEGIDVTVHLENGAGHKFPTGYPSRRAFLHVRVEAEGGNVVFESGRTDAYGRLVGRGDVLLEPATFAPHLAVVDREEQTQIYESVPVDSTGRPAHRPLDAHHYAKDNRLLPAGFDRKNRYASYTSPIGTDADPDFGSGDTILYRIARAPAGATVRVRLMFQTIRPSDIEVFAAKPTAAARRLFDMATAAPPIPVVVAETESRAP